MTIEPKFPLSIKFNLFSTFLGRRNYLIDEDTIRDLLEVSEPKTPSQTYRRAKLLEILEQNTSEGRGAEREGGL